MKNLILILILPFLLFTLPLQSLFSQTKEQIGLATVDKKLELEAYIMAEPERTYEKIFTVNVSTFNINLPDKGDLSNDQTQVRILKRQWNITDKIAHFATLVEREAEKKGDEVDAFIYSGGQVVIAIKFTDQPYSKLSMAKVKKESNIDIYVLNEPVYPYLKKKKKWAYDGHKKGIFKNLTQLVTEDTTVEADVYQMLRYITKGNPKKWPDGLIIYASGLIQGFDYSSGIGAY